MPNTVQIKFNAVVIGVKKIDVTFTASEESFIGIVRKIASSPALMQVTIDRNRAFGVVMEYIYRTVGKISKKCVDVSFTITTEDGYYSSVFVADVTKPPFENGIADVVAMDAPQPKPQPKERTAEAAVKQSKYAEKRSNREKAGIDAVQDGGGAVTTAQQPLMPQQRARNERMEKEAEDKAFHNFRRKRN